MLISLVSCNFIIYRGMTHLPFYPWWETWTKRKKRKWICPRWFTRVTLYDARIFAYWMVNFSTQPTLITQARRSRNVKHRHHPRKTTLPRVKYFVQKVYKARGVVGNSCPSTCTWRLTWIWIFIRRTPVDTSCAPNSPPIEIRPIIRPTTGQIPLRPRG